MPTQEEIDQALAEIEHPRGRSQCWAIRLKGQSKDFLETLERMEEDGGFVSRAIASDKFEQLFHVRVTQSQIGNHLNKHCTCR